MSTIVRHSFVLQWPVLQHLHRPVEMQPQCDQSGSWDQPEGFCILLTSCTHLAQSGGVQHHGLDGRQSKPYGSTSCDTAGSSSRPVSCHPDGGLGDGGIAKRSVALLIVHECRKNNPLWYATAYFPLLLHTPAIQICHVHPHFLLPSIHLIDPFPLPPILLTMPGCQLLHCAIITLLFPQLFSCFPEPFVPVRLLASLHYLHACFCSPFRLPL